MRVCYCRFAFFPSPFVLCTAFNTVRVALCWFTQLLLLLLLWSSSTRNLASLCCSLIKLFSNSATFERIIVAYNFEYGLIIPVVAGRMFYSWLGTFYCCYCYLLLLPYIESVAGVNFCGITRRRDFQ